MDGILLIDKPADWTSFDVVNKIRSLVRHELKKDGLAQKKIRVGHAGTLDPMATGLLIVLIGSYTKRQNEFMKLDKTYEASITLGANSTTDDADGVIEPVGSNHPSRKEVETALFSFLGRQQQKPPAVSAIKIKGQRAYHRVRQGEEIQLEARTVMVHHIDGFGYSYPQVTCRLRVSSGTYIRAIARDLGVKLGTGAYLSALRRTKIGQFSVSDATTIETLSTKTIRTYLLPG
jgi:tRNA pseudouridine55 synthase